jgi:hypothetical protein
MTSDVFLCYNRLDQPLIEEIAQRLGRQGISYWLDTEQLPPGTYWLDTQERDMAQIKAAAVFVGQHGIGKWQRLEITIFLQQFVARSLSIIPVFLPDAPPDTELSLFLKLFTWIDLRRSDPDPMQQLIQSLQQPIVKGNPGLIATTQKMIAAEIQANIPNNLTRPGAIAFVGRDSELAELQDLLPAKTPVAIYAVQGMGGIGKTELALQFAYQARDRQTYPGGVVWLSARQELKSQLIVFAKTYLGLLLPSDRDLDAQLVWCWQHWREGKTLLVLDDVQDWADVEALGIPGRSQFQVLMTTRSRFGTSVRELRLAVLSQEAALELLRSVVTDGRIDRQLSEAAALCEWLGNLPLGVELVGRYLAFDPDLSVVALLADLHHNSLAAEALLAAPGMTAELGVVAAFELSWQKLTAEAQSIAAFLSLFALSPFAWAWVEACFPEMAPALLSSIRVRQLLGLNLVQRSAAGLYQLHPLLREFFAVKASQLPDGEAWLSRFLEVLFVVAAQSTERPQKSLIEETSLVIPHLKVAIVHSRNAAASAETAALTWLAELYRSQGRYSNAEPLHRQALLIREIQLGANHPLVASSLNHLANLYQCQGRYNDAELLYVRSLSIQESQPNADPLQVAKSLNNLSNLYCFQERYSDAEPLSVRALTIWENQLGANHPYVAASLNSLALLYSNQERYSDAEPLYVRSLTIWENQLGANHPNVAINLNNLALLYSHQKRYSDAELLYVRSLLIKLRQLGKEHPDTLKGFQNFAICLQEAIAAGSIDQLSDHPLTQAMLQDLQGS